MVTFLLGATAVGKSAVAMELARRRPSAVLVMDALQVYRGQAIGVGKPTAAERAAVPHGGLDLADFSEPFDVARYVAQAAAFLAEQAAAGRRVLIVGGTGLYFRALTRGLTDAPPTPPELRDELAALSLDQLRERLERVDAPILPQLDVRNPRRLVRAIAVMETTGRSLGAWQAEPTDPVVKEYRAFWLQRPKPEMDARIAARVAEMFATGWVDEVRQLTARHGPRAVEAFAGIGYREIAQALDAAGGGSTPCLLQGESLADERPGRMETRPTPALTPRAMAELQRDISVATRQYAKRQLTWFRREPNLTAVTLSGAAPLSPALSAL